METIYNPMELIQLWAEQRHAKRHYTPALYYTGKAIKAKKFTYAILYNRGGSKAAVITNRPLKGLQNSYRELIRQAIPEGYRILEADQPGDHDHNLKQFQDQVQQARSWREEEQAQEQEKAYKAYFKL